MPDFIWLTDKESGKPALFRADAIDTAYVREDKVQEPRFNHMGTPYDDEMPTGSGPETRVLLRTNTYIAVEETPQQVYALIRGERSINDV